MGSLKHSIWPIQISIENAIKRAACFSQWRRNSWHTSVSKRRLQINKIGFISLKIVNFSEMRSRFCHGDDNLNHLTMSWHWLPQQTTSLSGECCSSFLFGNLHGAKRLQCTNTAKKFHAVRHREFAVTLLSCLIGSTSMLQCYCKEILRQIYDVARRRLYKNRIFLYDCNGGCLFPKLC